MAFVEDQQELLPLLTPQSSARHAFNIISICLTDLPADTIRDIFDLLDDKNLRSLLHVSRVARILVLVTLLTRHKTVASAGSPTKVSFSSGHTGDLERNINEVTKLTIRCNRPSDLITFAHVCLSLPNLTEVDLDIHYLHFPTPTELLQNRMLHLMYALSERNGGISNVLILDNGRWRMSTRTRKESEIMPTSLERIASMPCPIGVCYLLLSMPVRILCTYLQDPFAMRKQKDRLRRDIGTFIRDISYNNSESLQFKFKPLAPGTFPSWIRENWSLVVFNGSRTTTLTMGSEIRLYPPHGVNFGPALPSIHLPLLKTLKICRKEKVSMMDIIPFLARHPTIENLMLDHYSLVPPLSTLSMKWSLPNLTTLEAPLHYLEAILHDIDICRLSTICIGKRPQIQDDVIEKKFDFGVLDRVLETLTSSEVVSLMIVLPGGLKSQTWLAAGSISPGSKRAEMRMKSVRTIAILTERDEPFHQGIVPVLRDWLCLFCSIKLFRCVIPRAWLSSMNGNEMFGVPSLVFGHNGEMDNLTHWYDA